jgi:thiosulfate reductase cytochrome b subunit
MIPFVAIVSLRDRESRTFRMWVPLILVWLLFVPVVVLLSPLIVITCLACRVNPLRGFAVMWQILSALRKTEFELDQRSTGVSICIL